MKKQMILNPDKDYVKSIKDGLKVKDGYCPCILGKSEDNKCPCKKFRENQECCCKLYVEKVQE